MPVPFSRPAMAGRSERDTSREEGVESMREWIETLAALLAAVGGRRPRRAGCRSERLYQLDETLEITLRSMTRLRVSRRRRGEREEAA